MYCMQQRPSFGLTQDLQGKDSEGKNQTLGHKKLCYGCYQPITSNQNVRTCKERLLCRTCKECHPIGMHGYIKKASEEILSRKMVLKIQ